MGKTYRRRPGFAVGIVMTTRPFPYLRKLVPEPVGLPILFDGDITERDRRNIHFGEIGLEGSQLVTAGYQGWTMVVTGTGLTVAEAQTNAYQLAQRVVVPNVRYRNDIGAKLIAGDFAKIEGMYLFGRLISLLRRNAQLSPIAFKASPSAFQPHQRTLRDSWGHFRICRNEGMYRFRIPSERVLNIQD